MKKLIVLCAAFAFVTSISAQQLTPKASTERMAMAPKMVSLSKEAKLKIIHSPEFNKASLIKFSSNVTLEEKEVQFDGVHMNPDWGIMSYFYPQMVEPDAAIFYKSNPSGNVTIVSQVTGVYFFEVRLIRPANASVFNVAIKDEEGSKQVQNITPQLVPDPGSKFGSLYFSASVKTQEDIVISCPNLANNDYWMFYYCKITKVNP